MNNPPSHPAEPLLLARSFALVIGAIVVLASGLAWGPGGTLSALLGTALSVANVWVLHRLGARAVADVAAGNDGPGGVVATQAGSRLQLALGAKTIILLALVALVTQLGPFDRHSGAMTAFSLGLLVSVFALIAGGLYATTRPAYSIS